MRTVLAVAVAVAVDFTAAEGEALVSKVAEEGAGRRTPMAAHCRLQLVQVTWQEGCGMSRLPKLG